VGYVIKRRQPQAGLEVRGGLLLVSQFAGGRVPIDIGVAVVPAKANRVGELAAASTVAYNTLAPPTAGRYWSAS